MRNEKLGFEVPYVDGAEEHRYRPDFIALVDDGHCVDDPLHLVLEVKGQKKKGGRRRSTTRCGGCGCLRSMPLGRFGRWSFPPRWEEPYGMAEKGSGLMKSLVDEHVSRIGRVRRPRRRSPETGQFWERLDRDAPSPTR